MTGRPGSPDLLDAPGRRPASRRTVRWAVGITVLAALVDTVCMGLRGRLFTSFGFIDHGWPIITLTGVVSAVMGGLIVARDRRQPIGWLLLIPGVTTTVALALDAYSGWVLLDGGPGSTTAALICGWLSSFLGAQIPFAANAIILLLAPRGRLLGRGWSVAVVAAVVGCVCWSMPPLLEAATYAQVDPRPGPVSEVLFMAGLVLVDAAMVAGVVSLFVRRRRSRGVARVQIQWFIVAAVPFAISILWLVGSLFLLDIPRGEATHLPVFLAELAFPLAITVAVLRYRLYDITLVLNRAWLLLGATVVVGAGYVAVVGAVGGSADGFWPVLLASAVAACLFQPLRAHVVRLADRLAYGVRLEPYEALADLSRRLADSPGSDATLTEIADACRRSTGAQSVVIELHDEAGVPVAVGVAGADPGPDTRLLATTPISDGRFRIGVIRIRPAPGRPLGRRERQVVHGLSEHAALVFRNLRLEAGLRAKIDQLAVVADQIGQSRARLTRVRDDELARLERTLRTTISPDLDRLGRRLADLAAVPPSGDSPAWAELLDEVGRCLTALRDLSHGVHSDVLESIGIGAAVTSRLAHVGSRAPLTVTDEVTTRPSDPVVAITVERAVVTAVSVAPGIDAVDLTVVGDELVLRLDLGAHRPVPVELSDVVAGGGGAVTADRAGWVARFPLAPVGTSGHGSSHPGAGPAHPPGVVLGVG